MGLRESLDEDLLRGYKGDFQFLTLDQVLLAQILRELRKEGPEEKSKPIGGFRTRDDSPF
jgi:hypothetical protein